MTDLKSRILAADDRPFQDETISEWGDAVVRIRGLSGKESEAFARKHGDTGSKIPEGILVDLVVRTLEDPETGKPIFESEEDVKAFAEKSAVVITRLFRIAQELSGLGNLEKAKND